MIPVLMVMDVGNTNIVVGIYQGEELRFHWRLQTNPSIPEEKYATSIRNLFHSAGISLGQITGVVISSVVPPLTDVLRKLSERCFRQKPVVTRDENRFAYPV